MQQEPNLPLILYVAAIAVRTGLILLVTVIGFRVFGRRSFGGLNVIDILVVLLIANAVQNSITNSSGRLVIGITSAATLMIIDRVFGFWSARQPLLERAVAGRATLLAVHGKLDRREMKRQEVTREELEAAARSFGITDLKEIKLAILEVDGSISVIKEEAAAKQEGRRERRREQAKKKGPARK